MFDEILKKIEFFSLLSSNEIELINNSCKIITLNKNNILFYEGEIAKSFYILVQGNLKLYKTTTIGNEIIIHNFTQPTMLAEMATFQNSAFPATAISVSKITKVAILEKEVFISLLQKKWKFIFSYYWFINKKDEIFRANYS